MMIKSEQRMRDICSYIEAYQFEYRRTPTMDEIAEEVGTVKSNIFKYLAEMEQRGMISRRGREITTNAAVPSTPELNRVPVLGKIACGEPEYAEENFEEYIPLPVALFGKGDFFILRTKGLSMIEAGIEPGDMVVVRKQDSAHEGDIVVALVGNETTLKRYYIDREKHCIRLAGFRASHRT
jgi:repressor LexA